MTYKENITAILECYFSGFKKEIIDSACNRILEQNNDRYRDGLNDAWECAGNIFAIPRTPKEWDNFYNFMEVEKYYDIFEKYSATEAVKKIKEYEEKQKQINDEIKVGDEVYLSSLSKDYPRIVLSLYAEDDGLGLKARTILSGGFIDVKPVSELKRTGRHFDQIADVLEQLKKEKN